jgi:hypothetical protein
MSFGDKNPGKTFYVIRVLRQAMGWGAVFRNVKQHIAFAVMKNYIPVVDCENFKTSYNEDVPVEGTRNAWEYFFEQPAGGGGG